MIVCLCRRISHRDIEREVRNGCCSFDALQDELGVAAACGSCLDCARSTFRQALAQTRETAPAGRGIVAIVAVPMCT